MLLLTLTGLSADDASVFVNVGSDWFTSTRAATSASATSVGFQGKASDYSARRPAAKSASRALRRALFFKT